jgi:hypothetical protein
MSDQQPASKEDDVALVYKRPADIVVSLLLIVLGVVMAMDNWRVGARWASDGPQSGYFPFYLSLMLIGASAWGLVSTLRKSGAPVETFVGRQAFGRVLQVLIPTILFVVAIRFIGIYVSSAALIVVFMAWIGKMRVLPSIATALVFSLCLFWLFEVQFKVLLPKGPLESWLGF